MTITAQEKPQNWCLESVQAEITYVVDEMQSIVTFVNRPPDNPPADENLVNRVNLPIYDARPVKDKLSLDKEGFILVDEIPTMKDYRDAESINKIWIPKVQETIKKYTGASHVFSWACNTRMTTVDEKLALNSNAPARIAHTDFSPGELGSRIDNQSVNDLIAKITDSDKPRKWRFINVWQAISEPPQDTPLAFCDSETTKWEDYVIAQGTIHYKNEFSEDKSVTIEVNWVKNNPNHRWYYFKNMKQGEAIIFSGVDHWGGVIHRRVPHSAFDDKSCPSNAPPRNSIEIRSIAIID